MDSIPANWCSHPDKSLLYLHNISLFYSPTVINRHSASQLAPKFSSVRQNPLQFSSWYLHLGVEERTDEFRQTNRKSSIFYSIILWLSVLAEPRGLEVSWPSAGKVWVEVWMSASWGYQVSDFRIRWVTLGSLGTVMFEDETWRNQLVLEHREKYLFMIEIEGCYGMQTLRNSWLQKEEGTWGSQLNEEAVHRWMGKQSHGPPSGQSTRDAPGLRPLETIWRSFTLICSRMGIQIENLIY